MIVQKKENETQLEYIIRLIKGKNEGIYDISCVELFEQGFNKKYCEDEARKKWCGFKLLIPYIEDANYQPSSLTDYTVENSLSLEEKKERIKLRDERNLLNKYLRKISRLERYEETIKECVANLNNTKPLPEFSILDTIRDFAKVGVLQLSDWHYALKIDNAWNQYDIDIFKKRISYVKNRVIENLIKEDITKLYVLIQGDIISSSIHTVIRVKNQEDLISQIIHTSECLAEILNEFSQYANVQVLVVGGNHDRVTPKKDENLEEENYIRLTKWYLEERLSKNKNVSFPCNGYGYNIGSFNVFGMEIGVVHGHCDKFPNVVQKLSTFIRKPFDVIFTAHNHHVHYQDNQKCRVIANASLSGVDDLCETLRVSAYVGQNFSIIYPNKEVHLCPIIIAEET